MIVRNLQKAGELLAVLEENPRPRCKARAPTPQGERALSLPAHLRAQALKALPETLPGQIGCLVHHLLALLKPWASTGRAVALDSTVLRAKGAEWHKKDMEAGT